METYLTWKLLNTNKKLIMYKQKLYKTKGNYILQMINYKIQMDLMQ